MATPYRPTTGDFDMNSTNRRDGPYGHPSAQAQGPSLTSLLSAIPKASPATAADNGPNSSGFGPLPGTGGSAAVGGPREMEQRFAKLVAESEYKLLEERSRAHEREAKLREELSRERAQIPKLVEERLSRALAEKEKELEKKYSQGAGATAAGGAAAGRGDIEALKQQLRETQDLLADAERRYQQEKRELLNLRTAQLKNETQKRGQEGDIVGRAMQVMSEYETIVRSSEENSLSRLAHHMESFEKEWIRRSREFEERKGEFEMQVMRKALEALQMHHKDVESVGQGIVEKTLEMLRSQGESRLKLEEEVLRNAEVFKQQYKEVLEAEFRERCRAYDEKIADRERNLTKIMERERHRIIAAEQEAIGKHEAMHVEALTEAMNDVSRLREQLVREHQEQQSKAIADLVERRNTMRDEQMKVIAEANDRVREVERQCFEAVDQAQRALKEMQVHLIHRETELSRQVLETQTEKEQQRLSDVAAARDEVQNQMREVVEELRRQHLTEIERLTAEFQSRMDREQQEQFTRESEMRKMYEQRMIKVEEAADHRWAGRVAENTRALDRHLEVIQALRDDNEQLAAQLASLQQQFLLREQDMGQKITQIQREHEAIWHRKMEEMRVRYDQLLDEALGGPQGESVPRGEHEKALEQIRELEERCVQIKTVETQRLQHERDHLNELWKARLEEERSDRGVWEQEQLKRVADLRSEIYADSRRKETDMLRRAEQERLRLHEEAMGRTLEERKDRDAFEERVRMEAETRIRAAEEELNAAYAEKVRVLERRVEEKEILVERRRLELRREYAAMEESSKQQAAEWLEKEKREILADVKKFHEKLVEEQQRMETERSTFEQRLSMQYAEEFEQAKAALHVHVTAVTRNHLEYWSQCEQDWLMHRNEEMRILFDQRTEHSRLVKAQAQSLVALAKDEAQGLLRAEREALDARQAELFLKLEEQRSQMETIARDRALRLLDERNKIQEHTEARRAEEEAKLWEQLERRVLEKDRQSEGERRVLEMELRNRYESLMNSERLRMESMMEQHRTEAQQLFEKQQQSLRQRDDEWHRQKLQADAEQRMQQERLYQEVREQAEARISEEKRRCDNAMRLREQELDAERIKSLEALEKQMRDHEVSTRHQLQLLKDDYDRRVRLIAQEMHHQREEYIADLAEQERQTQASREEYEQAAMSKFEKSLRELRSIMEKRQREQQNRDVEAREALERQRREFEEKLTQQYDELLKSNAARLLQLERDRDARVEQLEKDHQNQLISLRAETEKSLAAFMAQSDSKSKESLESTRAAFEARLDEYYQLIAQERKKRLEIETALNASQDEKEAMRLSMEQYKLEVQRATQQKYEKLFNEVRTASRQDKEEAAKLALEEEEKKLAADILRRDREKRSDWSSLAAAAAGGVSGGMGASSRRVASSSVMTSSSHLDATAPLQRPSGGGNSYAAGTPTTSRPSPLVSLLSTPAPAAPTASLLADTSVTSASATGQADPYDEAVARRRDRLSQLWQVLDVPEVERARFRDSINGFPANSTGLLDALSSEIKRLELQLPLLEVITRREFLQHRLREQDKKPLSAATTKSSEELLRELMRLNDYLYAEIPKYESRVGNTFQFRGQRYMDVLLREMESEAASKSRA